jgi:hypothetical protein
VPEEPLPSRAPTLLGPSVFVGADLFNPPAPQGWLSITPTFTLSGEYNDNVFSDNEDRKSDFIIGFTPGVTVSAQRPRYRLLAGYYTSGQLSTRDGDFDFGKSHRLFGNFSYQLAPQVQFTLTEAFVKDQDSNAVTTGGASVGRRDSLRNTLTPRLRWQATPSTGLGVLASYTILRFTGDESDRGRDSDTYRLGVDADHRFTARLRGMIDFTAAFFDFEDEPSARTYTLRPGLVYDVTQTLRASVRAGPSFVDRDGDWDVRPAVSAALMQAFKFGSLGVGYDRVVTAETAGLTERQSFFAALTVPTLVRGLQLSFIPRYNIIERDLADSDDTEGNNLTLNLRATYQIARNISLIGAYTFFRQREDRGTDIDQNRVFLGVQYAFPINFY